MQRYEELKKRLLDLCDSQPEIKAAIIIGSQAREVSKADEYSDLDLIVACSKPEMLLSSDVLVSRLGKIIYSFVEYTIAGEKERRILFENSLDVDMIVMTEDKLAQLIKSHVADELMNRGFSLFYDNCGISEYFDEASIITERRYNALSEEEFRNLTNDFMFHTVWAEKKIRRGELWTAIMCVNGYLKSKLLTIMEMYEHCVHGDDYDTWHCGRMTEKWAEEFITEKLKNCFARYDTDELLSALTETKELFVTLSRSCAKAYGYTTGIEEIDN